MRGIVVQLDAVAIAAVVVAVLSAGLVLSVVRAAPVVITQVAVGVLLALALDPVLLRVRRRLRCSRATATAVVGTGLAALFAVVVLLLGPPAIRQAQEFAQELPETVEEMYSWPIVGERLERGDAVGRVEAWIDDLPARLDEETLSRWADMLIGGVGTFLIVLLTAIAVMVDGDALVARGRRIVPPSRRPRADDIGRIVYRSIGSYFAGSLLVAVLNGLVVLAAGLALGVPLAPLAAIWSMLTNLIPQIGGFLGGSFFVVLAFTASPATGVIALVIFLAYQQFENHVVQPAIVGKAVNLSPPTTMLAALVGGAAAGVPGALAATPLLGALKSVYLQTRHGPPDEDEGDPALHALLDRLPWRRRRQHRQEADASSTRTRRRSTTRTR
jgi:predicted PurR-regulated permease PerM